MVRILKCGSIQQTVYICFGSHDCGNTELKMNGDKIEMKDRAKHLGNILTKNLMDTDDIMFKRGTFIQNVNRLISNFGSLQTSVVMKILTVIVWLGTVVKYGICQVHTFKKCALVGTKLFGRYGICHIELIVVCCHI